MRPAPFVAGQSRDGVVEVYATPSEPNRLEGGETQRGEVVRYVPKQGGERTVVASPPMVVRERSILRVLPRSLPHFSLAKSSEQILEKGVRL